MLQTMRAVDYNTWLSMIDNITNFVNMTCDDYGISNIDLHVIPSYPKDLTKFHKPSIIVQKIHTYNRKIGMGNVLGAYEDVGVMYDIYGRSFDMIYQINIEGRTQQETALLTAIISEDMQNDLIDNGNILILNDYTHDLNNPTSIGTIKIGDNIEVIPTASNENRDYINMIRMSLNVIQHIVPTQSHVDLSKGIKYNQIIKL